MRRRETPPIKTLTDRQKYLLQRIPQTYELNGYHKPPDPPEVRRARAIVDRWEKATSRDACRAKKRAMALREKAREVIYFGSDVKALAVLRQVEKLLKGCDD